MIVGLLVSSCIGIYAVQFSWTGWYSHKKNIMRKRVKLVLLLMAFAFVGNAQMAVISSINGSEFCSGYGEENYAHLCFVSGPPIPVSSIFRLEFRWIVKHDRGTWVWLTQSFDRPVPLPFAGDYEVEAWVSYFFGGNVRPFASFRSNTTTIHVSDCTDE